MAPSKGGWLSAHGVRKSSSKVASEEVTVAWWPGVWKSQPLESVRMPTKVARYTLLEVPCTRRQSSGIRACLVAFRNRGTSKDAKVADSGGVTKEKLPRSSHFAKLNICAFDRETVMNKACILDGIVDIGGVKSGMN